MHVHVVKVHRSRDRHTIFTKYFDIVEHRPIRFLCEQIGCVFQRLQLRILLKHPRINHLTREQYRGVCIVIELRKLVHQSLG